MKKVKTIKSKKEQDEKLIKETILTMSWEKYVGSLKEINFKFDTTNRTGKLTRTITLHTNDPEDSSIVLTLYISITPKER